MLPSDNRLIITITTKNMHVYAGKTESDRRGSSAYLGILCEAGCRGDRAGLKTDARSVRAELKDQCVHATVLRLVQESGFATPGSCEFIEVHPGPLQRALIRYSLRSSGNDGEL